MDTVENTPETFVHSDLWWFIAVIMTVLVFFNDFKDPVMLERSVVSVDAGAASVMELHEMNRDSCFIKVNFFQFSSDWLSILNRDLKLIAFTENSDPTYRSASEVTTVWRYINSIIVIIIIIIIII